MSETSEILEPVIPAAPRRFQWAWVGGVLLRPRRTLAEIAAAGHAVWLTPLLLLSLAALLAVVAAGWARGASAAAGMTEVPPELQYYTPEQMAQYQQAMSATQGPVFRYVFPAVTALIKVWGGWLLLAALLHLILTLLGGRGDLRGALNLVAWSSLPLALRDLVRALATVITRQTVSQPGLAGFAPAAEGSGGLFLGALLGLIDLYLVWQIILLILGVQAANGLSRAKVAAAVGLTFLVLLLAQAGVSAALGGLGGLTMIRPFF
jgi:hypothetical protein